MDNSDAFQQLETSCHTHQSLGFIDTAFGSAANRNHVVSVGQLVIPGNRPDCYTTMYRFGEEYKQLCEETGSVRGASKQPCDCDFLWFDIDSGDLTTALVNARSLVTRIELIDPALSQHLAIYFSGSKGFHVGIPAGLFGWEPFVELPRAHRHLATGIAGDVQIDTAIYEHNRLWRVPNTRHGKSGLYKVPLTYEQLATWPIDQIKQLATRPTSRPALPDALPTPGGPHPRMRDMYMNAVQTLQARPAVSDSKPWQSSSVAPDRPCLQKLLRGVEAGRRNEAAIRLSAAFKRAGHSPEGILDELHTWNERNQPPLSDEELEAVCRSAMEGPYDYGCNDPVLKQLCDPDCPRHQKKYGKAKERRHYACSVTLSDGSMTEQVFDPQDPTVCHFVTYGPNRDACDAYDACDGCLETPTGLVYPYPREIINSLKSIKFPSRVEACESEEELHSAIDDFVRRYLSVSDQFHLLIPYYVKLTWVHDRFTELPYLRAIGGWGTGKSRFLKTVGSLCYRPIFCIGVSSVASIFRMLDTFRGTLVIDESDFDKSDESHQIIQILNTGYQSGIPVTRVDKRKDGTLEVVSFDVFGPKIIASCKEFRVQALESRCLTERMDGKVKPGLPVNLTPAFDEEALHLRNRLLAWRFANFHKVMPPSETIDLKIHPRLAQIINPLLSVIPEESVRSQLLDLVAGADSRFREDRADTTEGRIVKAILELKSGGTNSVSISTVTDKVNATISNERYKLSTSKVGRIVSRTLELPRERTGQQRLVVLDTDEAEQRLQYWCREFGIEESK